MTSVDMAIESSVNGGKDDQNATPADHYGVDHNVVVKTADHGYSSVHNTVKTVERSHQHSRRSRTRTRSRSSRRSSSRRSRSSRRSSRRSRSRSRNRRSRPRSRSRGSRRSYQNHSRTPSTTSAHSPLSQIQHDNFDGVKDRDAISIHASAANTVGDDVLDSSQNRWSAKVECYTATETKFGKEVDTAVATAAKQFWEGSLPDNRLGELKMSGCVPANCSFFRVRKTNP